MDNSCCAIHYSGSCLVVFIGDDTKMNKDNLALVMDEYNSTSGKASNITRVIIAVLSIWSLYTLKPLGLAIVLFWTLDILQYVWLSVRADLVLSEKISIKTSNKLGPIANLFYFAKIALTIIVLWS